MEKAGLDKHVYFQPPANVQMVFPAIVYKRDTQNTGFANNRPYRHLKRYLITVIDREPDSKLPDLVAELPQCTHRTYFAKDGLNHDVFTMYI